MRQNVTISRDMVIHAPHMNEMSQNATHHLIVCVLDSQTWIFKGNTVAI